MTDWPESVLSLLVSHEEEEDAAILTLPYELPRSPIRQRVEQSDASLSDTAPLLRNLQTADAAAAPLLSALFRSAQEGSALPLLARQVAESTRPIPTAAGNSAGGGRDQVIVVQEGAPGTTGITVGEFDRAVRRDSRRYDGSMTIY